MIQEYFSSHSIRNYAYVIMALLEDEMYVQDSTHILTQLRNRLLNMIATMIMGNYQVSHQHLRKLIESESKLIHGLCYSDINNQDKMNSRSAEKICDDKVIAALHNIEASHATILCICKSCETSSMHI